MQCGDLLGGRFEIGDIVREGGMGIVFRARDLRHGGQLVAVKTLIDASPAYAERFEREASLLARLEHPAVVRYVAHGRAEQGEPYLVMQWLEGEDLAERLARGPLEESEARDLVARLGDALGEAHALGIVHRDVKPSNVILHDNDVARAMLIDFGVAVGDRSTRHTRTGLIVGTPGYMAPEQARASRDVDARADVYALGCVLFECLTGRPPFAGEHPVAVLAKVLLDEPPRLRALVPSASVALEQLVARLLAKNPHVRPADGRAVARLFRDAPPPLSVRSPESVLPESITEDERVVVHVLLGMRAAESADAHGRTQASSDRAFDAEEFERRFGAHADVMADGSVLATMKPGALGAKAGATRAALAARELAREIGGAVVLASGLERIRRGVPLGQVVDRAVDLSRRAASAGAEGVIVDDLTNALLRGAAVIASRGGLHEVVDIGAQPLPSHPIVGRERELVTLSSLAEEVASEGAARVALVTAPPGAGKTRLSSELLARLRERDDSEVTIRFVRIDETMAESPLAVAAEIACAVASISRGDLPDERHARLAGYVARADLAPDAKARVMDFIGDILGATLSPSLALLAARTDAMTMSDQIQRAFVDLVAASCASPFVLAIDDLQWCDRASFRLIEVLVRELESRPLFLFGLARPDFDTSHPNAFAGRALTRLPLAGLGKRAAEKLVRDIAGEGASEALVAEMVARGEGNAFMLEELARGARDGRALDQLGGTTAVVASRFETLSPEARRVLRAASIVGQRASPAAVAALVGCDPDDAWLAVALGELEQAEIIAVGHGAGDGDATFRHSLLRDAAYATLTEEDKALGHKLAARFFDTALHTDPMIVAAHAEMGGELGLAARAYVDAAQSALASTDLGGVGDRVNAAIRCGAQGALLGRAERLRAEASFWLGDLREASDHATRALELFGDSTTADFFSAAGYLVAACSRLGKPESALAHTRRILVSNAAPDARGARTTALLISAAFLPLQGQIDLAKAILRDTKPIVEELAAENPTLRARYARARSICAMASGDLDGYLAGAREAADRFAEIGDRRNALQQRGNVVYARLEVGDDRGAIEEGRIVLAEAEKMGLRSVVAMAAQNTGYALVRTGALEEGQAMLESALREFDAQGHARMAGGTRIYLANARIAAHDEAGALREIDRALELLASTPPLRAYALAVRASILVACASPEDARVPAEEALSILDSLGGIDSGETDVYLAVARARLACGDEAAARAILKRGRDRVESRAARLAEPNRTTFLTKVPSNVALLALARKSS